MCGIAGYFSTSIRFTEEQLRKATTSLAHRGPDGDGFFMEGPVGLGHRRLKIIDLTEAAAQPMTSHDGRYVMLHNGEVYNYREIAKELGGTFKSTGDTEVILEAFARWGTDFLQRLNGMFAIAIYDKVERTLYLFRDRIGIKPVLYYWDGKSLAFASEMKALLRFDIARPLNTQALKDYLFLEYVPGNQTIFRNVHRLMPGHYLKVSEQGLEVHCYYDLLEQIGEKHHHTEEQAADEFADLLKSSVGYRTISDVPIGAFLSGGTDSSLICATYQQLNATPIKTFTIGFDEPTFDESEYARQVAQELKTDHHPDRVTRDDSMQRMLGLPDHFDEPFAVPSMIPTLQVCSNARQHATVAMSGDGGDELFMGYGYYRWYDRVRRLSRSGQLGRKLASALMSAGGNRMKRAARVLDYPDARHMWLHVWSQEQYMFSEREIGNLFGEPYRHETLLDDWERIRSLKLHPWEQISLFDLRHYLSTNLLFKVDIASMAYGLEVRVPYLDHRVVEFVLHLPINLRVRHGERKYLMKKLLERYLPDRLVYRTKWGFPAPVNKWLQSGDMISEWLSPQRLDKHGLFKPEVVNKLINEFRTGREYHYKRLWALIFFQMWWERYAQ